MDLSHHDLSRGQQCPEEHGGRFSARQDGLRLDPPLEFLVQTFDGVRGSDRLPLALREARESEQSVACFFQAVGDGAAFEPPFSDEGFSFGLHLLAPLHLLLDLITYRGFSEPVSEIQPSMVASIPSAGG